jgi:hypothetical protein
MGDRTNAYNVLEETLKDGFDLEELGIDDMILK